MSFAIRCLLLGALAARAASIRMGKESVTSGQPARQSSILDKVMAAAAVNATIPTTPGEGWVYGSVASISATGFTKPGPDGVGNVCTGIGDGGELPMLYQGGHTQAECEALSTAATGSVGYQFAAARTLCYIYFATEDECNAAPSTYSAVSGWSTYRCGRCYGGCPTYSPSGPFSWYETQSASGTTTLYTCYYKGSVTTGAASPAGGASGTGDPHLRNIYGQAFDLMQPGRHVLLLVPRGAGSNSTLLRVEAEARRVGERCADMYFTELAVTGAWAEARQSGGVHFRTEDAVGEGDVSKWMSFGKVDLKVAHGHTKEGVRYLNFYVRRLRNAGLAIGGLLGEDDHEAAATPDGNCRKVVQLNRHGEKSPIAAAPPAASLAAASMA